MNAVPLPVFDHILRMTDGRGTFEHAAFDEPRTEHGYCTDDMARVLVVTAREPRPTPAAAALCEVSLRFLREADGGDGGYRNRLDHDGHWTDRPTFDDCWGRSLWGLGTAAARADAAEVRETAGIQFERAVRQRSPWLRAMSFAALGAAEVVAVIPDHEGGRALLGDAADRIATATATSRGHGRWPWPEPRLSYANAVIPEVLLAAGSLLDRPRLVSDGLDLLRWLVDHETTDGHLSVTPAGGSGPGDGRPAFDQQPIEVAAIADACARAAALDGDDCWPQAVAAAIAWFLGDNDGGHVMWDASTGGGFDGLEATGPNRNQGTESTLAFISTLQHAHRPALVLR